MKKNFSAYVLAVLTLCMLVVSSCSKEDDTNTAGNPTACISSSSSVVAGSSISFTSCSSAAETYSWDFGVSGTNADVSTQQNPSYTYTTAGTYTVTLTVSNSKGTNTTTKTITVTGGGATAADYQGTYTATTSCGTSYDIVLTASGNSVSIYNFSTMGDIAYVTGTANANTLTVPSQGITPTNATVAAFTASLSGDKQTLTFTYTASEGGSSVTCTVTAIKQ